ncbi:MAG: hypothetical protein V1916_01500, partial [Patescibacteria group bacterium]
LLLSSGELVATVPLDSPAAALWWSPDSNYLAVASTSIGLTLVDARSGVITPLPAPLNTSAVQVLGWRSAGQHDLLVTSGGVQKIFSVPSDITSIEPSAAAAIYSDGTHTVMVTSGSLVAQQEPGGTLGTVAVPTNAKLVAYPRTGDWVPILDTANLRLYLLSTRDYSFHTITVTVSGIFNDRQQDELLLYGPHEVWRLNLATLEEQLVVRTSATVQAAAWLQDHACVIYSLTNRKLIATESTGTQKNAYDLLDGVENFFTNQDGTAAVVLKDGSLYQLQIL